MANTDKQNFRYNTEDWGRAQAKAAEMREKGWDIDLTALLSRAVDLFLAETPAATAKRLGLQRAKAPVPMYRRPAPRVDR